MANPEFFRPEFDRLAVNGYIGAPAGKLAYAYLRVSSAGQAEEGRSGLPRQLEHIHEAALRDGFCISWDMVFADDHSGFAFEDRPQLSRLRAELRSKQRRADAVVIEHLDRLSRNADWHQGFLLDEMGHDGVVVSFHTSYNSRIERAVMGAISQDAMQLSLQRMAEGTRRKAQDGRITCKIPAIGYRFVDSKGKALSTASRDTHYAVSEDAWIIKLIFEKAALGNSLRSIATMLQSLCPDAKAGKKWHPTSVRYILANPLYKGQYVANRWIHVRTEKRGRDGTLLGNSEKMVERSQDDWIVVPVPPIVSADLWESANAMLLKNKERAKRNNRDRYILTGVLVCAECGRKWLGVCEPNFDYRCPAHYNELKHLRRCTSPSLSARKLHTAIWGAICQILLQPTLIVQALDNLLSSEATLALNQQIAFLKESISSRRAENERVTKGFLAGVFDAAEAAQERQRLKRAIQGLESELAALTARLLTPEQIEAKKTLVLAAAENARDSGVFMDAPPDFQRSLLKLLVDRILVDSHARTLRIEGVIPLNLNYSSTGLNIVTGLADSIG